MIFPNVPCSVTRIEGYDDFGNPQLGLPKLTKCCIVKLEVSLGQTSIRTDKSASQGNADEIVADARLLLPGTFRPMIGDVVTVRDIKLVIVAVRQKFTALVDKFDHYEVDLTIWE